MSKKGLMLAKNKLVVQVGKNDANYPVCYMDNNNKRKVCPKYHTWWKMLRRCYDEKRLETHPTYKDCFVCDEWLTFSNFLTWMITQDWDGKQLDKDLLFRGNKIYSPNTCCFIPRRVNIFLIDCGKSRGSLPLWVTAFPRKKLYAVRVRDPFGRNSQHIKSVKCPIKAHKMGQEIKHTYALELAELESDVRIKKALSERYSPDKNWLDI